MNETPVAMRYARALIQASEERDALDRVREDLEGLLNLIRESEDLRAFLSDPLIYPEQKRAAVRRLFFRPDRGPHPEFPASAVRQTARTGSRRDYSGVSDAPGRATGSDHRTRAVGAGTLSGPAGKARAAVVGLVRKAGTSGTSRSTGDSERAL